MQLSYRSLLYGLLCKGNKLRSLPAEAISYDLYNSAMPNESAVRISPTMKMV